MSCVNCETLKDNIAQLELMIATLEQENRQQHARNQRLQEELNYADSIIQEYRDAARDADRMPMSYARIKESFNRTDR